MAHIQYIVFLLLSSVCSHIGCHTTVDPGVQAGNFILFSVHDGVLQAWLNRERFIELRSSGSSTIKWSRQSCFDPAAPDTVCPLDVQLLSMSVQHEETTDILMPGFTYNSEFQIEIVVEESKAEYGMYFAAPHCSNPDVTFTVCRSATTEDVQTTTVASRQTEASMVDGLYLTIGLCSIVFLMLVVVFVALIYQHTSINKLLRRSKANTQEFSGHRTQVESILRNIRLSERSRSCSDLQSVASEAVDVTTRSTSLPDLDRPQSSIVTVGGGLVKPDTLITME